MRKNKLEELHSYIDELKTIKLELRQEPITSDKKFINVETYICHINNGKKISRDKIIKDRHNGDASIVLPITKDNTAILTVQPRVFTKLTVGISLPAGYIEHGETHIDAAKRELLEETGYNSDKIKELCDFYQDDGCSAAFNKGFLAEDCIKAGSQKLDDSEFIRYFECSIDELLELYEKGYILDGGSQLVIERAKNI